MHDSAMDEARLFAARYATGPALSIADIGSRDVNGSMRGLFGDNEYIGFDIESGKNVDVLLGDPESFDIPDASFDRVISANCLEHTRRPWIMAAEMTRICKAGGYVFILMPAHQAYHAYPIDCWRCYAEGMRGLLETAGLEVIDAHDSNGRDTVGIGRKA